MIFNTLNSQRHRQITPNVTQFGRYYKTHKHENRMVELFNDTQDNTTRKPVYCHNSRFKYYRFEPFFLI